MKQLKPGQVCMIHKHVYRCKKRITEYICQDCREANKTKNCMFEQKTMFTPQLMCLDIFGVDNYPVLVK